MIGRGVPGASSCGAEPALNSKNALPKEGGDWAPPAGLEPAAKRLEGACSIH